MNGIYKPGTRKRYTIRYLPHGRYDNGPCWGIWDHQLHDLYEAGYTKEGAIRAANFHNYRRDNPERSHETP